jgi:hypothetical protein
MTSEFDSGEVDALVMVRSKATVLDDIASGPLWLMVLRRRHLLSSAIGHRER